MNEFVLNLAAVSFSECIRIVFFSDITANKPELSNKNIIYMDSLLPDIKPYYFRFHKTVDLNKVISEGK